MSSQAANTKFLFFLGVALMTMVAAYGAFVFFKPAAINDKPYVVYQASPVSDNSTVPIPDILPSTKVKSSSSQGEAQDEIEHLVETLVNLLVTEHSAEIHLPAFQVSLKEMRDDLIKSYPSQGLKIFERIIRGAFPKLADQIMVLLAKLDVYDEWLLSNMLDLNDMNLLQQQGEIWQKRYEVFGKDLAEAIWEKERSAEEDRRDSMLTTVDMLNQSSDMSMQDRVFLLKSAYDENYFGTVEDLVLDATGLLSQVIFELDVVQSELDALSPEARQLQIDEVRRLVGFDESQISWLAQRDQEREVRWQNGYAYMAERAQVVELYEGEDLVVKLDALREKYFKHEAATIKKEEEQIAFFRYKRERVYGRN